MVEGGEAGPQDARRADVVRVVSLDARYTAARTESNTRLLARQSIGIQFVATVAIALGIYLNLKNPVQEAYLLAALSILALVFIGFYVHHDRILGVLSQFCKNCEIDSPFDPPAIPSWHLQGNEDGWMNKALGWKRYSDGAMLGTLVAAFLVPILYMFGSHWPPIQATETLPGWTRGLWCYQWAGLAFAVLAGGYSGWIVFRTLKWRRDQGDLWMAANGSLVPSKDLGAKRYWYSLRGEPTALSVERAENKRLAKRLDTLENELRVATTEANSRKQSIETLKKKIEQLNEELKRQEDAPVEPRPESEDKECGTQPD